MDEQGDRYATIGRRDFRSAIEHSSEALTTQTLESNGFAAQYVAQTVGDKLD